MKKNKREEKKRMERKHNNRNKRKKSPYSVDWENDTQFTMHFHDQSINSVFNSITVYAEQPGTPFPEEELYW